MADTRDAILPTAAPARRDEVPWYQPIIIMADLITTLTLVAGPFFYFFLPLQAEIVIIFPIVTCVLLGTILAQIPASGVLPVSATLIVPAEYLEFIGWTIRGVYLWLANVPEFPIASIITASVITFFIAERVFMFILELLPSQPRQLYLIQTGRALFFGTLSHAIQACLDTLTACLTACLTSCTECVKLWYLSASSRPASPRPLQEEQQTSADVETGMSPPPPYQVHEPLSGLDMHNKIPKLEYY